MITGPTASGKSSIAFALAQTLGLTIVSCDSRQIYRGMDIGTAKPSLDEQSKVSHRLINIIEPIESYSLYHYFDDATAVLEQLKRDNVCGLVCGGTGLYLRSLIDGVGVQEESDPAVRDMLTERVRSEGCQTLHDELKCCDPECAEKIHANDAQRIIRALSVYHQTGKPLSVLHRIIQKKNNFRFNVVKLTADREWLYRRINERVDKMIAQGLYDEFRELVAVGCNETTPGMQCVGYRELFAVQNGTCSFDDAVEMIKRNTRRFAKRQITWFSHQQSGIEIDASLPMETLVEKMKAVFSDSAFC